MTAAIIDGTDVARASRARTASRAAAFQARHGIAPGLATVLVGDDPASKAPVTGWPATSPSTRYPPWPGT